MKLRFLAMIGLMPLLSACATSTPLPAAQKQAVVGAWKLQQASKLPAIPGSVRVVFHASPPQQGQEVMAVSGFAGVNSFRGSATVNMGEQRLMVGTLATTRMRGNDSDMQFESAFVTQLQTVVSFQWQDQDTLVLKTLPGETLTFVQTSR